MSQPGIARTNHLSHEKSPYLLQHAAHPVDWYPWCEEAFERAHREDKPIFLSVGYSACHWCHVMADESFADQQVANLLNESFISIKVDREERPDIDGVYMAICQMMIGTGGWPLTIIMTPDQRPFFAATYIPRENRYGRAGMLELLPLIRAAWQNKRDQIDSAVSRIIRDMQESAQFATGKEPGLREIEAAYNQMTEGFDRLYGGFGTAPKFPSPHNLLFLLRYWKRTRRPQALAMVEKTLAEMRRGGIYDQIGFGFHRYSTDARWFMPHFEKMLYDQALLAMAYTEAWQVTHKDEYRRTTEEICDYVLRELRDGTGGFYCAQDADSEGQEGKYYLWQKSELEELLGSEEAALASKIFGVSPAGNYQEEAGGGGGANILYFSKELDLMAFDLGLPPEKLQEKINQIRTRLLENRQRRIPPFKDDKILTDWNGLMIAALAKAAAAFQAPTLLAAARAAAEYILNAMRAPDGGLWHFLRHDQSGLDGYLDDYAFMGWGLLELFQATSEARYLREALTLTEYLLKHFWDERKGGFFFTSDQGEKLIHRKKNFFDGALPSGNSAAALNLFRLAHLTGRPELEQKGSDLLSALAQPVRDYPIGHAMLLNALDFHIGPVQEIVVAGRAESKDAWAMLSALGRSFLPDSVVVFHRDDEDSQIADLIPFLRNKRSSEGQAVAYVCRDYSCSSPTTEVAELLRLAGV